MSHKEHVFIISKEILRSSIWNTALKSVFPQYHSLIQEHLHDNLEVIVTSFIFRVQFFRYLNHKDFFAFLEANASFLDIPLEHLKHLKAGNFNGSDFITWEKLDYMCYQVPIGTIVNLLKLRDHLSTSYLPSILIR